MGSIIELFLKKSFIKEGKTSIQAGRKAPLGEMLAPAAASWVVTKAPSTGLF